MSIQTKTMTVKSDTSLAETTTTIRDTVTFDVSKMPNGITYKGLKAVLSFADPIQWNKASTYDALTVVWDDATHASYASKRRVPQNIELTNEFYWLRTADLDAQVEMYRAEVQEYRQEVQAFDGRITANAQAIVTEKERAEAAEQTLQSNIDLKEDSKKYMLLFGDSWTDDINGTWGSGTKWYHHVCKALKLEPLNYAQGGYRFGPQFDSELDKAKTEITDEVKANITEVVIYGGLNNLGVDRYSGDAFVRDVKAFVDKVYDWIDTAKITVVLANSANVNSNRINMKYVHDMFDARQLMYLNITNPAINIVFGQYWTLGFNCFSDDNYHLNELGNKIVASRMIQAITGGDAEKIWGSCHYPFIDGVWTPAAYSENWVGFPVSLGGCSTSYEAIFRFGTFFYNSGLVSFTNIEGSKATITLNFGKIEPKRAFINVPGFKTKYTVTDQSTDDNVVYTIEITNPNGDFVNEFVPCDFKFEF